MLINLIIDIHRVFSESWEYYCLRTIAERSNKVVIRKQNRLLVFYCVKIHHTPEGRERNHATTGAQCGACVAIELKKVSKVDPLTEHRFEGPILLSIRSSEVGESLQRVLDEPELTYTPQRVAVGIARSGGRVAEKINIAPRKRQER